MEVSFGWFEMIRHIYSHAHVLVKPSQQELEHVYREVEGFSLASHYYWGLWALVQATISDIDFDYLNYAILRFNEYERRKKNIFPSL